MSAGFGIGVYMHLMPFFRQAIPNHLRQFFGCYLGFLHGSVPAFPTNYWASESFYKRDCYYFLISLNTFQRRLLWPHRPFPSVAEFCSKVWRVGHMTQTNNAPAARFGPTQS
jgi:hypothetical protein